MPLGNRLQDDCPPALADAVVGGVLLLGGGVGRLAGCPAIGRGKSGRWTGGVLERTTVLFTIFLAAEQT